MEISGIYDSGPISPVAKVKENLAIWVVNSWTRYSVEFVEPIPRSGPYTVDLVIAGNNNVPVAAGGTINASVLTLLQMNDDELLQIRWEPIDDVEGRLWQLGRLARFNSKGGQAAVSLLTKQYDPFLASTQFFILGRDKDPQIGCFNPLGVAQPTARFIFFGYRYTLKENKSVPVHASPVTYIPATGM